MSKKRCVIIGNGAAGIHAAEALRSADRQAGITIVSDEPVNAYSKVLLHYYIDSQIDKEGLFIRSDKFYHDQNIQTIFGAKVESIYPDEQRICLSDGSDIEYDTLLIATGSVPYIPAIYGVHLNGVSTMWTLADAREIRRSLQNSRQAIIIGGSFIGMQALDMLKGKGLKVTVVDLADRIMPHILDEKGSAILRRFLEEKDITFFLGTRPAAIKDIGEGKKSLDMEDGTRITADFCILSVGARPNIDFLKDSPLNKNAGLVVDEYMCTNYHNIFAAGDVAEVSDRMSGERRIFGLWSTAVDQGRIAGLNMAGKKVRYPGGIDMNVTSVLGLPILTIGKTGLAEEDADNVAVKTFLNDKKGIYRKFIIRDEVLIGAILMGHVDDGGLIGSLIRSKIKFDPLKSKYSAGSFRHRMDHLTH